MGVKAVVNSIVRVFVFVPVIALIVAGIFHLVGLLFPKLKPTKPRLILDAAIMYPLLRSAFAQIACIFTGCCAGQPVGWGLYNKGTGLYHFPVQLLETVLTLLVFAWLLCRLRKHKYQSDGLYMPYMFIGYGIIRFICEALRDNEKLLPLCSAVGLHALALAAIGAMWLLVERKFKSLNSKK